MSKIFMMTTALSVMIMAFNERANLEPVVRELEAVARNTAPSYEIVIIDDGSTDGTGPLADQLAVRIANVRVIHHTVNQGLGGVYRTGFAQARGDVLTFFPADGQFPATILAQFWPLIRDCDMVLGYVERRQDGLSARALSWIERGLYHVLFGNFPKFQGITMFRRRLLQEMTLTSAGRGWAVLMELILRASRGGYRIRSALTPLRPRISGVSKVKNVATIVSNLRQLIALRRDLHERPLS
jgi:glycosyltransferase involved in cell wall biosynthesis